MSKKAYFIDNETEELFEISATKRKELEKTHPNWHMYNMDTNYEALHDVYEFFKTNGKLLANRRTKNIFVGLLE